MKPRKSAVVQTVCRLSGREGSITVCMDEMNH